MCTALPCSVGYHAVLFFPWGSTGIWVALRDARKALGEGLGISPEVLEPSGSFPAALAGA